MTNRIAILCSGQAGQHAGMFDLIREDDHANRLLLTWPLEELCGYPMHEILSSERLMFANPIAQPLVVAAQLATWEIIRGLISRPVITAGYSIGELASWSVAGAIAPDKAIRLAAVRAQLLQACIEPGQPQLMLAISLSHAVTKMADIESLLHAHGFYIAIEVAEDAVISGGLLVHADALENAVTAAGGKVTRLPIEIASHTPWMKAAVSAFEKAVQESGMSTPRFPVLAGISGARLHDKNTAATALSRQLAEPIRWQAVMDSVHEAGVTMAIELGPGAALSKMLKTRYPHIQCRSVSEFKSLSGLKRWLHQAEE